MYTRVEIQCNSNNMVIISLLSGSLEKLCLLDIFFLAGHFLLHPLACPTWSIYLWTLYYFYFLGAALRESWDINLTPTCVYSVLTFMNRFCSTDRTLSSTGLRVSEYWKKN